MLGELADQRGAEAVEVGRASAGHEVAVDDDLLVHVGTARVDDVGPQARPTGESAARHRTRLDQQPGPVTDRRDRFADVHRVPHERDRMVVGTQPVRPECTAGQDQSVVTVEICSTDEQVDGEPIRGFDVAPVRLDLAERDGQQFRAATCHLDRAARLDQLILFHTVGSKECHPVSVQLPAHRLDPSPDVICVTFIMRSCAWSTSRGFPSTTRGELRSDNRVRACQKVAASMTKR
ncbi:hypothetical protein RHCRD62_40352 [Rhodococcus sp. RD6.2]|nr:hypothetical protein RHCRD62_40352 [Rhodococcus sp. RD6.2]